MLALFWIEWAGLLVGTVGILILLMVLGCSLWKTTHPMAEDQWSGSLSYTSHQEWVEHHGLLEDAAPITEIPEDEN